MEVRAVRTLVVDDEEGIRFFLQEALHQAGYVVTTAASGEEALELLEESSFDLIVLDLMLGGRVDGQRVLEAVRWRWPETVVVILTAHGSFESALAAIDEGVDGYLLKPAKQAEVLQTLQAASERREKQVRRSAASDLERVLQRGPFSFDLSAQQLTVHGQPVALTPNETRLLVHLMQNEGRVISAKELVRVVLQYDVDSLHEARQTIKWYVHCLRRKVEADPSNPSHILNVRGVGYMFQASA
jgi:DNA-binding response OmpR family regulator